MIPTAPWMVPEEVGTNGLDPMDGSAGSHAPPGMARRPRRTSGANSWFGSSVPRVAWPAGAERRGPKRIGQMTDDRRGWCSCLKAFEVGSGA